MIKKNGKIALYLFRGHDCSYGDHLSVALYSTSQGQDRNTVRSDSTGHTSSLQDDHDKSNKPISTSDTRTNHTSWTCCRVKDQGHQHTTSSAQLTPQKRSVWMLESRKKITVGIQTNGVLISEDRLWITLLHSKIPRCKTATTLREILFLMVH